MGVALSYSLFSSIILSLLYLTYKWVMAGENQHGFNRGILWVIYGVALASPFLAAHLPDLQGAAAVPAAGMMEIEAGEPEMWAVAEPVADAGQPLWLTVLLWIYVAGMTAVLIHTAVVGLKLRSVIAGGECVGERDGKMIVVTDNAGIAPFSWCRYVVMNRRDYDEDGGMILTHEMRHLQLGHWVDLLMAQAVGVFQWYNPAAWLMREELKTVHEYQADSAVLSSGVCARDYQMLLLKKAVGARFPSLANSLNHSKLKKRITMMFNQKTSPVRRMRGLALVPALVAALSVTDLDAVASVINATSSASLADLPETPAGTVAGEAADKVSENSADGQEPEMEIEVIAHAGSGKSDVSSTSGEPVEITAYGTVREPEAAQDREAEKVYSVVEKKPEFPGGDPALLKYVAENLRYPEAAYKAGTQGRVIVQFVVKSDGGIGEVKVLRSVSPELDAEAVRVVRTLPAFTPGMVAGKPVGVWYNLPITFRLTSDKPATDAAVNAAAGGAEPQAEDIRGMSPEELAGKVFTVVEKKPQFPGGDAALLKYVAENLRYPEAAHKAGVQGRVVVQFVVKSDGGIGDVKVIRSVSPELDAEAVRVIRTLPAFTPGSIQGHPVAVLYTLPVTFRLSTDKPDTDTEAKPAKEVRNFTLNSATVKKENIDVYVDGTKVEPDAVDGIDPSKIASVDVVKGNPTRVNITLKP